jgi:hypothetical protein
MIAQLFGYLRDHSVVLKWVFFAYLAFTLVFDFFAERHQAHFWGDSVIGFWTLFGIFGCLGMIVVFKGLSHVWLVKGEDYYDE